MKYQKTIILYSETQFKTLKVGQWFQWHNGSRGQYLGQTKAGAIAVRHQNGPFGKPVDLERNKLTRKWAKANGAK